MNAAYPNIHVVLIVDYNGQFVPYNGRAHVDADVALEEFNVASLTFHSTLLTYSPNAAAQPYYEITLEDVHKAVIKAFGREWAVTDFLGRIMKQDIGKRVYLRGDVLQVENTEQFEARRGK